MDIKKIIKQTILFEVVTGDESAHAGAKGSIAIDTIKDRMASMGVSVPDIEHLFSIPQLKVEPFKLSFVLQKVIDKPQELTLPETEEFSGLAKVVSDSDNLTIEFKPFVGGGLSKETFDIIFLEKEITTNLPGTDKSIKALSATGRGGKFYHVQIPGELFKQYNEEEGGEEEKNGEKGTGTCKDFKVGQELTMLQGPHKGEVYVIKDYPKMNPGFVNIQRKKDNKRWAVKCEDLSKNTSEEPKESKEIEEIKYKINLVKQNKMNNEPKIVEITLKILEKELEEARSKNLENKPKAGDQLKLGLENVITIKKIIKENLTLFLEEDGEQLKIKFPVTAEIYLSSIELGSKGKAKKRGDINSSYGSSIGGTTGKHITVKTITNKPIPVSVKIRTNVNLSQNKEVQNYVNTTNTLMMRKSNSNKDSIILWFKNQGEDKALVVKILDPNKNLFSGPLNVEVGTQALGDTRVVDSFNATLQLSPK